MNDFINWKIALIMFGEIFVDNVSYNYFTYEFLSIDNS